MSKKLANYLINLHDGISFSDGRSSFIQIDDRRQSDKSGLFCEILVRIAPDDKLTVEFSHAPMNSEIRQLIRGHDGRIVKLDGKTTISLPIADVDSPFLRNLADAFRQAIKVMPGQRGYKDPHWKWKCPRIARSLELFADTLDDFFRSQAQVAEGRQ
jgi:hypothetical protein